MISKIVRNCNIRPDQKKVCFSLRVALAFIALTLSFAAAPCRGAVETLRPSGAINDFADILGARVENELERFCTSLYNESGVALVVSTVDEAADIDQFTNRLYEEWGIGAEGVDEGVLVVIAVKNRKIRIETGYGVEGYITDAHAGRIIREVARPYLSRNDWDRGVAGVVYALSELIAKNKNLSLESLFRGSGTVVSAADRQAAQSAPAGALNFLLLIIVVLFFIATPFGRAMLPFILLSAMSGQRRSYYGGGFGGGFSRGGFGGFGGGMSGGGGASGDF